MHKPCMLNYSTSNNTLTQICIFIRRKKPNRVDYLRPIAPYRFRLRGNRANASRTRRRAARPSSTSQTHGPTRDSGASDRAVTPSWPLFAAGRDWHRLCPKRRRVPIVVRQEHPNPASYDGRAARRCGRLILRLRVRKEVLGRYNDLAISCGRVNPAFSTMTATMTSTSESQST